MTFEPHPTATFARAAMAVLAATLPLAAAAQAVQVDFPEPPRYTDAGPTAGDVARTEAVLRGHLEALGARYLRPGDRLQITLRDIDLAGDARPGHATDQGARVLRGQADVPVLVFGYRLDPVRDGEAGAGLRDVRLSDLGYLQSPAPGGGGPLPYERRLLERWFAATFGPPH